MNLNLEATSAQNFWFHKLAPLAVKFDFSLRNEEDHRSTVEPSETQFF